MGTQGADIRRGAGIALRGIGWILRRPALWPLAAVTWAMYVAIFVPVAWFLISQAGSFVDWVWARPEGWIVILWWVAMTIAAVAAIAISVVATSLLASIANAPIADRISDAVEREVLPGRADEPFRVGAFLGDVASGVTHSILNLSLYLLLLVPVLAMNLIPLVGSATSAAFAFVLTAVMVVIEFVDHPLARRRWAWRRKVALVREERALCGGYGAVVAGLSSIPLVNVLLAPAFIVGGTLLFAELVRRGRIPGEIVRTDAPRDAAAPARLDVETLHVDDPDARGHAFAPRGGSAD